jgi:hypothetical protein
MTPSETVDDAWTAFLASLAQLETRIGVPGLDEAASAYSPWLRAQSDLLEAGLPPEMALDIGRLVEAHDHSILHVTSPDAEAWAEGFAERAEAVTLAVNNVGR